MLDNKSNTPQKSGAALGRRGTFGENCHMCGEKVYLLERHIDGSTLYHRHCFRTSQRSQPKPKTYTANLNHVDGSGEPHKSQTSGLFQVQNRAKTSLSSGATDSQDKGARGHPYQRQSPKSGATENKIDRIAELYNEGNKKESTDKSSNKLLLLGYTNNAYKPSTSENTSVFTKSSSAQSNAINTGKPEPYVSTFSSKPTVQSNILKSVTPENNISSQGKTIGSSVGAKSAVVDDKSETNVVSGLLNSLANVRNNYSSNQGSAISGASGTKPSNIMVLTQDKPFVQRNNVNNTDNVSHDINKTEITTKGYGTPQNKYSTSTVNINSVPSNKGLDSSHLKSPITKSSLISTVTTTSSVSGASKNQGTTFSTSVLPNKPQTSTITVAKQSQIHIPTNNFTTSPNSIGNTHSSLQSSDITKPNKPPPRPSSPPSYAVSHSPDKPKSILKTRPNLNKSEDIEIDWTSPVPVLKPNAVKDSQNTQVKSILKKTSDPTKSTSGNGHTANLKKLSANHTPVSPKNNYSAFNLADSIDIAKTSDRNLKNNKTTPVNIEIKHTDTKGDSNKPAWMLEAEKRQRNKLRERENAPTNGNEGRKSPVQRISSQLHINTGPQYNVTNVKETLGTNSNLKESAMTGNTEKWTSHVTTQFNKPSVQGINKVGAGQRQNPFNEKPNVTTAEQDARPEWMKEAERRKAARGGQYVDPEKNPNRLHWDKRDGKNPSPKSPSPVESRSPPPRPAITPRTSITPREPVSPQPVPSPRQTPSPRQPLSPRQTPSPSSLSSVSSTSPHPSPKRPAPPRPAQLPVWGKPSPTSPTSHTRPVGQRVIPAGQVTSSTAGCSPQHR